MIPKEWLETAQLVSSAAAACGLFIAACQMYWARLVAEQTRRSADVVALQKFFNGVFERERDLAVASDADEERRAFNLLLDFLEIHAGAHNRHLFGPGSEQLIRHKLEDSIIELEAAEDWHALIAKAIDRASTFEELRGFIEVNRREIDERRAEHDRHQGLLTESS